MLRLTFLGTGTSQGVPMIGCNCDVCLSNDSHDKRLRSSVMIEQFATNTLHQKSHKNTPQNTIAPHHGYGIYQTSVGADARIVIDAGPDFRHQMLRENVKTLNAILLTHEHKDHTAGIDDVRAFNYFEAKAIPIYATTQVALAIKKDYGYIFGATKYPGGPEIELHTIDTSKPFNVASFHIIPIVGRHYLIPTTGYRIGKVAYLTDFNHIDEAEIAKLKGVDVLVINALRYEKHISHFTVDEAIDIAIRIGAKKTYLTHMSHQIGRYANIHNKLPNGIEFATDGLIVDIDE